MRLEVKPTTLDFVNLTLPHHAKGVGVINFVRSATGLYDWQTEMSGHPAMHSDQLLLRRRQRLRRQFRWKPGNLL